jgi:hypothetical protein
LIDWSVAPSWSWQIHRITFEKGLKPVGLLFDEAVSGLVFVSTRGKTRGPVKAINPVTREVRT